MFISCIIFKRSMGWTNPKRCLLNHNIMCNTTINNNFSESTPRVKPKTALGKNNWNVNWELYLVAGACSTESLSEKERDLTLTCTQQDRSQKPRSAWQVNTFTTDDISTRCATPSLSIAHLLVDDNSRLWKTWVSKHRWINRETDSLFTLKTCSQELNCDKVYK